MQQQSNVERLLTALQTIHEETVGINQAKHIAESAVRDYHCRQITRSQSTTT